MFLVILFVAPFSWLRASEADPLRINVGGSSYTDRHGRTWSADHGFVGGRAAVGIDEKRSIENTDDDALYRTYRYSTSSRSPMRYRIPVRNGEYTVRLHFAETDRRRMRPGRRVFDVQAEEQVILNNLDIVREGGRDHAVVRSARVKVKDSSLDLTFGRIAHNPLLNAIEVIPVNARRDRMRPGQPGRPRAAGVTKSSITLVWSASKDDVAVAAYEIRRDGKVIGSIDGRVTRFTDRNLGSARRYRYEITARDRSGNATTSTSAWIASAGAAPVQSTFTLTWTDNSGNEDGFRIERSSDGRSFREVARVRANVSSYRDTSVEDGARYWYRVHAYNTYGRSGYSNTIRVVTGDPSS